MVKKKRKYNPNLIKGKSTYSAKQLAERLKIHLRTIQGWRKQGLADCGKDGNSYLMLGEEIRRFLKEKKQKSKYPLKTGEFFCPKCRNPRKSLADKISVIITNKKLGKTSKQAFIKGVCEICNTSLMLFSSDKKINELQNSGMLLTELKTNV